MHSRFGFLSYEISHVIRQRFNKEAEKLGFSHAHLRALAHLSENENCRQIDLAEILEIKPITLARQVDLLEDAGLVQRIKDSEDRRAYRLQLTEQAVPILRRLWEVSDNVETKMLNVLSKEQQVMLINNLQCIKENIQE